MPIRIPEGGALSRKERDELKAFGQERGLRVFDDVKRLERDFPSRWRRCASAPARRRTICCCSRRGQAKPKGHRPEETVYQACGQLRLQAAQKYTDRHKLFDPRNFEFLWVMDFPMFEWDEEEKRWNRGASSVHLGAR